MKPFVEKPIRLSGPPKTEEITVEVTVKIRVPVADLKRRPYPFGQPFRDR